MQANSLMELDATRLAGTTKALREEFGDKMSRKFRETLRKAAGRAVIRARGYLPAEDQMPSGFAYVNKYSGWPKANAASSRNDGRPFPRYRRNNAAASVRVRSYRAKAIRTETGWVGGRTEAIGVEMNDAAGAIYDTTGKGKRPRTEAGERLLAGFNRVAFAGPDRYRVVLPAVIDTRPDILREIDGHLRLAERAIEHARATDPWRVSR